MKKIISTLLTVCMLAGVLAGCNGAAAPADDSMSPDGETLSIVTTIFPEYDWVRQILGDQADEVTLTLLLHGGVDLHSYQPTMDDMIKISTCDVFIYVGGESDGWVESALQEAVNQDMVVINLMDALGDTVKEEEVVEGMEAHDHDHEGEDHDHEHAEGPGYDEHVWLSLKNTKTLCAHIAQQLGAVDAANAAAYESNTAAYLQQLDALDTEYQAAVDGGTFDTLLFGDRFPFRYLVDDYGLNYYAAFAGCSAESEASFETIVFLANKVDELGLTHVLTIENANHKIAETVIENTVAHNQSVLTLDSMQSVTADDVAAGATYFSMMQDNLSVLKEALN